LLLAACCHNIIQDQEAIDTGMLLMSEDAGYIPHKKSGYLELKHSTYNLQDQ